METLKKLRRLAKPGDWCFGFDLQDGLYAVGIHPEFQRFMQFDLRGELFQCSAMPFGWNDAPRVFCKFVRVMVEALRSPQAAEDRREIRRLRDGSVVRQRWSVRRRAGGANENANRHSGMRVLPYMDDSLVLVDSQREGLLGREKFQLVLHRLGLRRNEKKSQWDPVQVVEHLGLEVDLKLAQFRVTEQRMQKIHSRAKEKLCDAARNRRWIPARRLAAFTGLCQSVYLAVPAARLYLRELYFLLAEKRSWGAKVNISCAARGDLEWWSRLPVMSRWNECKIWRSPTRAKLHTDSSMTAWGGVLNLKFPARGFWPDEMRNWHITHLDLEAVYKTVQAFLKELESKVVRLYCDNQAVVAMLSHFISRNPDLVMRRMRRLWSLLDSHDIELQAARPTEQWGPFTVERFASEISAQLPRYYAAWRDPQCKGVDSLVYDWRGENNWVNPPWALLDEVAHKLREEGAAATVDGKAHVLYDDGDEETLDLSKENFKIISSLPVSVLTNEAAYTANENVDKGADYKVNKRGGAVENFLTLSLCERWRSELGRSRLTELAVKMQRKSLLDTTLSNYGPKAQRFIHFCVQQCRPWLPATEATVVLYVASVLEDRGVQAASMQPHLSAIDNYHEDLGFPGPAKGRALTRAVKGMATIQAELAMEDENIETQRTWLPAGRELVLHWQQHRDAAWRKSSRTQPDSYWLLPEDPKNIKASVATDWISQALSKLGLRPPEGGHFSAHSARKGATTCARAVGVAMEKVCFFGGWSQFSSAVQHYIDPTALRDTDMNYYFEWLTWSR
ncbi:hypothetical protein CYMTET_4601 [Cymbomonas tetramitiformis]|uniref:Reverse transcriptase domain-containing protein n=1 Tax=Cymbomonas tetramitiformis TaxID=36881 RepID=A0AAE0H146_9CHLO|nr:hypothetical protein CYMTET_4601 [Cymbomonas tetramitiformis]